MDSGSGRAQDAGGVRGERFENLTPHEALETERVAERKRASLPVEEFVHLKDIGVAPAQALAVAGFDQTEILPDRADRQDPARRPVRSVVSAKHHVNSIS